MLYEVLVIAEERPGFAAKLGEVVTAKPSGHRWGKAEGPPRFQVVTVDLEEYQLRDLLAGEWIYNFPRQRFVLAADPAVVWVPEEVPREKRLWRPFEGLTPAEIRQMPVQEREERFQVVHILEKLERFLRSESKEDRAEVLRGNKQAIGQYMNRPVLGSRIALGLNDAEKALLNKYLRGDFDADRSR